MPELLIQALTAIWGYHAFSGAQDASTHLPYSSDIKVEDAFKIIEKYNDKVEAVRAAQVWSWCAIRPAVRFQLEGKGYTE